MAASIFAIMKNNEKLAEKNRDLVDKTFAELVAKLLNNYYNGK